MAPTFSKPERPSRGSRTLWRTLLGPRLLRAPGRGALRAHVGSWAYLDAAGVRLEAARGVLGGDPALDGTAVDADVLLPQAQVGQAPALGHMDLGVDQVHTAGAGRRWDQERA